MAQQPMNDDETLEEKLGAEAQLVGERALTHTPTEDAWGIESYGDAPGGIGGGEGAFLWFDTQGELLDFTGRLLPFFAPGSGPLGPIEVAQKSASIIEQVQNGELSMDEAMGPLNRALRNFSQIRWWGQLKELLSGDREFENMIRSRFRYGLSESDGDTSPIPGNQLNDFIDFIMIEWM